MVIVLLKVERGAKFNHIDVKTIQQYLNITPKLYNRVAIYKDNYFTETKPISINSPLKN